MKDNHYLRLLVMILVSFISMFVLMYTMVDVFANVLSNLNQFYMAGLMATAMVIIEISLMGAMYHLKKWNAVIMGASSLFVIGFFLLIRQQTAITDRQFLKSMIPHHASALLMCKKAQLEDSEIKSLCGSIIAGQQEEIDHWKNRRFSKPRVSFTFLLDLGVHSRVTLWPSE